MDLEAIQPDEEVQNYFPPQLIVIALDEQFIQSGHMGVSENNGGTFQHS